jgi:hypothetical protein
VQRTLRISLPNPLGPVSPTSPPPSACCRIAAAHPYPFPASAYSTHFQTTFSSTQVSFLFPNKATLHRLIARQSISNRKGGFWSCLLKNAICFEAKAPLSCMRHQSALLVQLSSRMDSIKCVIVGDGAVGKVNAFAVSQPRSIVVAFCFCFPCRLVCSSATRRMLSLLSTFPQYSKTTLQMSW